MGRFEDATAQHITKAKANIAVDIVYHRGAIATPLVKKVWCGRTTFRVVDEKGSRLIFSDKDFLIPVADLIISGVAVTPQDGDWIEQVFSGPEGNQAFEMMAPESEPKWRYSDPQRMIYRIHTKRVIHS